MSTPTASMCELIHFLHLLKHAREDNIILLAHHWTKINLILLITSIIIIASLLGELVVTSLGTNVFVSLTDIGTFF